MKLLLTLIALLCPPLAVAIDEELGERFWLCLVLTILAYFPGLIFALFCIWSD